MELKDRLNLLVDKDGNDSIPHLLVEQIVQLEQINEKLDRGIVVYEGGEAEDVEEDE